MCKHTFTQEHTGTSGSFSDNTVYELQDIHYICASEILLLSSVFSLLFLSLPYLWSRLPPLPPSVPLFLTDLPLFYASVVFHQRRTAHLSALALLTQERPAFAQSYCSTCGQACVCVHMCTLLIHSIAGIPWHCCPLAAHHRPLKGRISCRFLSDGLRLKCFIFCFASVNSKLLSQLRKAKWEQSKVVEVSELVPSLSARQTDTSTQINSP